MVRVMLEGVHIHRKKLADGTVKEYHYAWRGQGAPRLEGKPGSPQYLKSYQAAHAARKRSMPTEENIAGLATLYQQSAEFDALKKNTRDENARLLKRIVADLGSMPTVAIEAKGARGEFKNWRNSMRDKPRTADKHWAMLRALFSWAMDQEIITRNPCFGGGKLAPKSTRRDKTWTETQIQQFLLAAPDNLRLAMLLGLWTSQRQGDLLAMTWKQYDGTHITFDQHKTDKPLKVLASGALKDALDNAPRSALQVLVSSNGQPWGNRHSFKRAWQRVSDRAGIEGVSFGDLRGTAVTRLVNEVAANKYELVAITGHSLATADKIIEGHYLDPLQGAGDEAIRRLEANKTRNKV